MLSAKFLYTKLSTLPVFGFHAKSEYNDPSYSTFMIKNTKYNYSNHVAQPQSMKRFYK